MNTADGGVAALIVTDGTWRVSGTEEAGWTELGFDDSAWIAATAIADGGAPPWVPFSRKRFSLSGEAVETPDCPAVADH